MTHELNRNQRWTLGLALAIALTGVWAMAAAQHGDGHGMQGGGMGMMHDGAHGADMQIFHALFDARDRITRQVTRLDNGVETVTESSDPAVARLIQAHVVAMSARLKERQPIHQRDPLFREIFAHADDIAMQHELTATGVKVVETSSSPYVAALIQQHADVISRYLANGRAEMMRDHPVPAQAR